VGSSQANAYVLDLARPARSKIVRFFQEELKAQASLPPELQISYEWSTQTRGQRGADPCWPRSRRWSVGHRLAATFAAMLHRNPLSCACVTWEEDMVRAALRDRAGRAPPTVPTSGTFVYRERAW